MTLYWRLRDMPELRDEPESRRRRLWREAVARSTTPRRLLTLLGIRFAAAPVFFAACYSTLPFLATAALAFLASVVAGYAAEVWITTPAARAWLREHAHELDRYASA